MKQLFRHTTSLLRTALLLGAMILVNTQAKAQNEEQRKAMPDAFETIEDVSSIINDGKYYYIQFYNGNDISYLVEHGDGNALETKDYLPFTPNRLWTLVDAGGGKFYLKSKRGTYARLDGTAYKGTNSQANATALTYYKRTNSQAGGGYEILVEGQSKAMQRNSYIWDVINDLDHDNHRHDRSRLRIARLKTNIAHIIYWQETIYKDGNVNNPVDPNTQTRAGSAGFTPHHYLTSSGTDDGQSDVSSRKSVLWYYDAWALPTAAAYHQDGLWTLEPAGPNGEFYIKKYGSEEYVNYQPTSNINDLGTKSSDYGVFTLEGASYTQRFVRVLNGNKYSNDGLTANMFFEWNGYGSDATKTSNTPYTNTIEDPNGGFTCNIGNGQTIPNNQQNSGNTVYGYGYRVNYLHYADLTGYTKVIIEGTKDLELRFLMNRVAPTGSDPDGDSFVERLCTIGSDGKVELDLSDLPFIHLNSIKVKSGSGTVSAITLVKANYNTTTLADSQFYNWNGYGADAVSSTTADIDFKVGTEVGSGTTIVGTGDVHYLIYADLTGSKKMVVEATPGMQLRVLLNRQVDNDGPLVEKRVTINSYGKGEIDLSDLTYVHLNAIKADWNSPSGTVKSIKLLSPNSSGSNYYMTCQKTDGAAVSFVSPGNNNIKNSTDWYAGFLPVEVPVPNKDEFYQVLVKWGANMINHGGGVTAPCPTNEADYDLWQLEMIDDYGHFRLKAPDGRYLKPGGQGMTEPNNPEGAEIMDNAKFFQDDSNDFSLTWYYVNPAQKEIPVNHYVTHRESYLKEYAQEYASLHLDKQGLTTDADSEWKNWNGNLGGFTQKVNHFEITHYIKRNDTKVIDFPTVLNKSNDHIYFQRFYNYDEVDTAMDLDNLKAHVSLDDRDDGNVQYFLYKNGMVTGQKLDWTWDDGTAIPDGGYARNEQRRFNFTNSDGRRFTVAVDVSRYDDKTYANPSAHLQGDLKEPSLTMRYIYYMRDAKEMAANLTAKTFQGYDFVDSKEGQNFLEAKTFHFPMKQIFYESQKKAGYRGEFIGLRHIFSDYWVFDGDGTGDENLVSAVIDNTKGRIVVRIHDPNGTGIRLGGYNPNIDLKGTADGVDEDYQGFYFYDKMSDQNKTQYGDSRFVSFRYPADGQVHATGEANPAYVNVYLNNNGTLYQLAQFTIIFDPGTVTLPYKSVHGSDYVMKDGNENTYAYRGPKKLIEKAGTPIAKVTFDYPANSAYHFPAMGDTKHGWGTPTPGSAVNGSSPLPLTFEKTNYSYDAFECNWGSYSIVSSMTTNYGNHQIALPANDSEYGYGKLLDATDQQMAPALQADEGLQKGFLYIDASEQPGDICSAPFVGDFCAGDKLMFSGWISGSNKMGGGDNRCPGGITLTVKGEHNLHDADGRIIYDEHGEPKKETVTLYRFCPGQIYELDDGPATPDGSGVDGQEWLKNANGDYIDGNGNVVSEENRVKNPNYDNNKYHVVWQQFYFEFTVTEKYDRHWIEVNNNCVSSQGGDFMLDNIAVYAIVPEVLPQVNTPLCVSVDDSGNTVTDMRLLKLSMDYNKLKSSSGVNESATELPEQGFVFLDKKVFLEKFREKLQALTPEEKHVLNLDAFDFTTISLEKLSDAIEDGEFVEVKEVELIAGQENTVEYKAHYKAFEVAYHEAFDAAILGEKSTWHSRNPGVNMHASVLYFEWDTEYENMPVYSFAHAVNKTHAVYREVVNGEKFLVMNGNFPQLNWKTNTEYYIITSNQTFTPMRPFVPFNICSECAKTSTFQIEPPYSVLGLDKSSDTGDYVVCEGQVPTLLTDLKGFDLNGNEVPMKDLNYDWWLGNSTTLATLENYHTRNNGSDVRLDKALSTLRIYYPDATDLDGIISHLAEDPNPELTTDMVQFLKELVDAGELVLHQKSISVPATPASKVDPYFYLVACPIHDEKFDQALNPQANQYVAFFCDEPQGLRIKVGDKAPRLNTGFVAQENGFASYNYTGAGDAVLSIRLAKKEQFETVKHGLDTDYGANIHTPANTSATDTHFLWLPIRNAQVQSDGSTKVIQKSADENIYLASTDDPTWDKNIYTSMNQYDTDGNLTGSLPVVGKIVQLNAIDVDKSNGAKENDNNRLCVYFTENFEVREGYNYTLSLPFQESPGSNVCDGTLLINLKIVPDYEVWTGGAGNTDWNNDQNWRRADGNMVAPPQESTNESKRNNNELLVSNDLPATSKLKGYVTNYDNYRTPKDRILRKGFAPLYCTHVLIKSNEWGDAPVLYDALDTESGKTTLAASPFPNLRDQDGWNSTTGETATKATATPILRYDMQARLYDIWADTYKDAPNKGRAGDLIAEMYQVNSCDEIAFQPGTELRNAHLLNYNSAWMEYQLDMNRWYLLGSPLQGTIAGEWYAPTGTAQQKTTYYEPVTFGQGYDRYSPAIYQRSWDKAKAVLYEIGADYATADDDQTQNLGTPLQGAWSNATWDVTNADRYLDRLGYKPMSGNKANVAMQGIWSNTYNDATVDYTQGGFSVMVKNDLKGGSNANPAIIRLPKEDTMYDYYKFDEDGSDKGGTDTELSTVQSSKSRAKNRGRLKSDLLLPMVDGSVVQNPYQQIQRTEASASRYGDQRTYTRVPTQVGENALPMTLRPFTESVSAGISNLGYYLVENPFACGLDMKQFFEANTGLQKKYWLLVSGANGQPQQQLVQQAESGDWFTQDGTTFTADEAKVAPGQGFFVQAATVGDGSPVNITFNSAMQAQTRYGEPDAGEEFTIVVGTKQKMETINATYDDDGNPETAEVPLMIDDPANPGQQVQATIEVPKKNKQTGEYEVEDITDKITVYKYKQQTGDGRQFPLLARTLTRGSEAMSAPGMVITAERGGRQSCALVMQRDEASDEFMPQEDTEVFLNSDLENVPTVYTLCGRLATTINSIHDFRSLPVGVESNSSSPCTLTFQGVETLGDSIAFYDALEQKLMPLESGMKVTVSGQTQNRYYIVRSLNQEDAAEETHLQIFTEGLTAKVIASTAEPITDVRCFDTAGRQIHSASPQTSTYSFSLPAKGIYIIEAQTDNDRKTVKLMAK